MIGDSSLYWTGPGDSSRSHLSDMIQAELEGVRCLPMSAGGYNGRIIKAYLAALERCRSRPRAVLVPTSVQMATTVWLAHPEFGYETHAEQLTALIESGARLPRKLEPPSIEQWDAYHRMPAPSRTGAQWNVGEVQMVAGTRGATPAQKADRLRHNMDLHWAERLEPDSPGVRLVAELGSTLRSMGLPSLAYIQPVNHELVGDMLGAGLGEHMERNASLVEAAFREGIGDLGTVVNSITDSPPDEFFDPVHLNYEGRRRFAERIAASLRPMLER